MNYIAHKDILLSDPTIETRPCAKCGGPKYPRPYKGTRGFHCYPCSARTKRAWKNHIEHGLTIGQIDAMTEAQLGLCYICGLPEQGKDLAVDHNAKTGEVRKLLCQLCNRMLGLARENPEILRLGAEYLEAHGGRRYYTG